jgi:hypothetical protein
MSIATISIKKGGKVLIVEDNKDRLEWFMCKLPHEKVWNTDKPDEAVRLLKEMSPESFDAIFLDYDLGPEPVKFSTITSKPVVDYLNSACPMRRLQHNIIIHSGNSVAADWAAAILPGAFKLPFGTFTIEEKENV